MSLTKAEQRILRQADAIRQREVERLALEFDRVMMAGWSDDMLRHAVASVEAGNHDGVRFVREGYPLPSTVQALVEELAKRGWPPVDLGQPDRGA